MVKISSREIIDVVKFNSKKIIIAEKAALLDGGSQTGYYVLDLETGDKEVVTKSAYLMKKFGNSAYKKIGESISDFSDCEAAILPSKNVFIIFSNGQCAMYGKDGETLWTKTLTYNEKPVTGLAADGEYIWCCCKDENCVIRYLADSNKLNLDLRVGAIDADTFRSPCFVSSDDEGIYVCCSNKLRKISRSDFVVSDVSDALSGLKRFYRFGKYTLVCTIDGAYIGE
ncbi:MAG: hypothetical protein K6C14_05335 [Eubacterium sp.]|nr:hypothetical protein [Eubacterium sp.]